MLQLIQYTVDTSDLNLITARDVKRRLSEELGMTVGVHVDKTWFRNALNDAIEERRRADSGSGSSEGEADGEDEIMEESAEDRGSDDDPPEDEESGDAGLIPLNLDSIDPSLFLSIAIPGGDSGMNELDVALQSDLPGTPPGEEFDGINSLFQRRPLDDHVRTDEEKGVP